MKPKVLKVSVAIVATALCFCPMLLEAQLQINEDAQRRRNAEWTEQEKRYYETLREFCNYMEQNEAKEISRDTIIRKFFLFDYVLRDTSIRRIEERLVKLDSMTNSFRKYIKSAGIENLDARPLRFCNPTSPAYKPFLNQLAELAPHVFYYYRKGDEEHPLGTIWFDQNSGKVISWILINQGGYYYFLTFSIL